MSVEVKDKTGRTVVVGSCMRQEWYVRMIRKYPDRYQDLRDAYMADENDTDKTRMRENSGLVCDGEVARAKHAGVYVGHELPVKVEELGLRGRVDLIIVDPSTADHSKHYRGDLIGVELKSVGTYKAQRVLAASAPKYRPAEVDLAHALQTGIYDWYDKKTDRLGGIRNWEVFYVSRDGGLTQGYMEYYDPDTDLVYIDQKSTGIQIENSAIPRLKKLRDCVDNDIKPDRDFEIAYDEERLKDMAAIEGMLTKTEAKIINEGKKPRFPIGDAPCKWCAFKEQCWNDEEEDTEHELI